MRRDEQLEAVAATLRAGGSRRVIAPGGMGKSSLLRRVARLLDDRRVAWWSPAIDPDRLPPEGGVLLADDVHLASADSLRALVRRHGAVVAAHRPTGPEADALLSTLDSAPLVLSPLGTDDVRAVLAEAWDTEPTPEVVERMHAATAGVPRLVVAVAGSRPTTRVDRTATLDELVRSQRQQLDADARALLDAAAVLPGLDLGLLAAACCLDIDAAPMAASRLASSGLASSAAADVPDVVADAVRRLVSDSEIGAMVERAAASALDGDHDLVAVAERIHRSGVGGPAAARCLLTAAGRVLDDDVARAQAWVDAAARAGAVPRDVAALRALVGFRQGNPEQTVSAVDEVLRADPRWTQDVLCREAVEAAAVVLARRGSWLRSADLAEAVGPGGDNAVALAAIARMAVGDADGVRSVVRACEAAPAPGLRSAAAATLARGLALSLTDDPAPALALLLDAARLYEVSAPPVPLPEPPHTLAAVVASHLCEFDIATQILTDSPNTRGHGSRRRDLLDAWTAQRRGDLLGAAATVDRVRRTADRLGARDVLLACAVVAGVARRRSDVDGMAAAWREARALLLRQIPDLLLLEPVGELLIVGARLGDRGTVSTCLSTVRNLVERAGQPPLWTLSLLWDELHVAIALGDLAAARAAAKAADALAVPGRVTAIAAAALCWVDVLGGDGRGDQVRTAARALADVGLTWEGAKLVGAQAIRTADNAQMRELLGFARSLEAERVPPSTGPDSNLSPRERDVAGHLLAGLTYREIGAQLYIAPKTVEHHVARIRRKLGATSRAEMLLALRHHAPAGHP